MMNSVASGLLQEILSRKPEPDVKRLRAALGRSGLPDRVPFMELFADPEIMASILRKPARLLTDEGLNASEKKERLSLIIRFYEMLGYDYVPATVDGLEVDFPRIPGRDPSPSLNRGVRKWAVEGEGAITTWEGFKAFPWPDPEGFRLTSLEHVRDHLPAGMGLVCNFSGVLEWVMWLMGFRGFFQSVYRQPGLVDAMFEKVGELFLPAFRLAAKVKGLTAFFVGDDWGFKNGTMISPRMMREKVFPWHRRFAEIAHSHGVFYLLHSCGNLSAVMDYVIDEVRIDGKHSYEDTYLPVTEAKKLYGDRIAVIGGVDVDYLCRHNVKETEAYVAKVLEGCMPGGGYCLGTGNSVANYIPVENYLAMLKVGLDEGTYA